MRAIMKLFLLFGLALTLATPTFAIRSSQCPGGCIIASIVSPERQCTCVKESCPEWKQATAFKRTKVTKAPTALGGVDCGFCDRAANTYASFADCYAADTDFKPKGGPGISKTNYPELKANRPIKGNGAGAGGADGGLASRRLLQTCPPAGVGTNCPNYADPSYTAWEVQFPTATSTTDVTIPAGMTVVLNGCAQTSNTVSVKSITIPPTSKLIIGDSPLNLNFNRMDVNGTFQMGTPTCPIQSLITITVPGGTQGINGIYVVPGGKYDIHGFTEGFMWTRIASTVPSNTKTIPLQEAVSWKPGNKIVLVSTIWKDELTNQNEVLTIDTVSADGKTITTVETIQFEHYGGEYQAEVALLSRRILFTSDATSTSTGLGPHTMMRSPDARITGAAFEKWGARNVAGRYSIHFHIAGNAPNAYLKNNAVYNSNWRCITIHGTNDVTLYNNVGFNVHGHCYYLEDGVEERNVLERNLAAYVHPIHTAGSAGGQQGTDRWQNATLFDPSDSGASGFYSLNAYNTWLNNAASGGFAGYTFPHAPRAIKDHKGLLKPNGYPFDPSERPFIQFKGNTAHSTGYFWEHSGCFYFGGMLMYNKDPADGQIKLFYNNGRGSVQAEPLCPDPQWPANDSDNYRDCWVGSARRTRNAADTANGFLMLSDNTASLCNVGVMSWGDRIEVSGFTGYDVTRGSEFLGQSWLRDSYFKINTQNSASGRSGWPYTTNFWEGYPIKGFEFYDTMTSSLLSNITFENYKYKQYTTNVNDWWYNQTPHCFRMLSHSDQFKPDKTMMVTKGIKCVNCDFGTCSGGTCTGGAFFKVDKTYRSSSWYFNWLDQDGSIVRHVQPTKPIGPYLITSDKNWWKLDDVESWLEPKFNGVWVSPMPATEVAARLEMRIQSSGGSRFTVGAFDGQDITKIGYVSQFGDVTKQVDMTKTEGVVGMTGKYGWYTVWNTSTTGFVAPKRVELVVFNVPRTKFVYWSSCWPAGTTLSVARTYDWASCQNEASLIKANTRDELLATGGNHYFVDANTCLHLKIVDPGHPWEYTRNFQRDGMYIEEEVRWYDYKYTITASGTPMSCGDTFFCPLSGDPATRVPPAITYQPTSCGDAQPSGTTCGNVKCAWTNWPGCSNSAIVSGKYCQASCNTCPAYVATPSPPPAAGPLPSPPPAVVAFSPPPPRPPPPARAACLAKGSPCNLGSQCCSRRCSKKACT